MNQWVQNNGKRVVNKMNYEYYIAYQWTYSNIFIIFINELLLNS